MFSSRKKTQYQGFTLIELIVVMAIIAILSTSLIMIMNVGKQTGNAKVAKIVSEMRQIHTIIAYYVVDTGRFPPDCRLDCTANTDPFLNSLGIDGWNGPYLKEGIWNRTHPWGGHLGIYNWDSNSDGKAEVWLILDDDAPGTNASDNSGRVPLEFLQRINDTVDEDSDLNSGDFFRGDGSPFASEEGAWRVYQVE